MDDEEEFEDEDYYQPARRLQGIDAAIVTLELCRGIASAVTNALSSSVQLLAAHANYRVEQQAFQEEAALEIETIVTGEQDA